MTGERIWFNSAQTAQHVNSHRDTVLKAAEAGELHGYQRTARGRWRFHRECIDAWMTGAACAHQANAERASA